MHISNQAWKTHQISNQFDELQDYNLFETDQVLQGNPVPLWQPGSGKFGADGQSRRFI